MLKKSLSKFIRRKMFYNFWRKLYLISLYGMNMGPASGYPDYSGEDWIIKFIRSKVQNSLPTIFDVGANVGDYSAVVIDTFGLENLNLYCFEPSPSTFEILSSKIRTGENTRLHNLGFGDKTETARLYSAGRGEGATSIFNDHFHIGENATHVEDIALTTIDEFCRQKGIKKIDFLKMDVEGCEFNVLKGADDMIAVNAIDFIQFEFAFPNIASRVFFRDIYLYLESRYDIYKCLTDGLIRVEKYDYYDEIFVTQNFLAISKKLNVEKQW